VHLSGFDYKIKEDPSGKGEKFKSTLNSYSSIDYMTKTQRIIMKPFIKGTSKEF